MKRNIFISLCVIFSLSATAQQIKQEVIASAGGFSVASDNSLSISWTLGETIVPTFTSSDGSLVLTPGFQQKLIVTAVQENIAGDVKVTIYPNPASELINIEFDTPTEELIQVTLLDARGRLVKSDRIESSVITRQINLQDLPAGLYYLRLTKGKFINVYKVVKL
jgi:hypothetical protein